MLCKSDNQCTSLKPHKPTRDTDTSLSFALMYMCVVCSSQWIMFHQRRCVPCENNNTTHASDVNNLHQYSILPCFYQHTILAYLWTLVSLLTRVRLTGNVYACLWQNKIYKEGYLNGKSLPDCAKKNFLLLLQTTHLFGWFAYNNEYCCFLFTYMMFDSPGKRRSTPSSRHRLKHKRAGHMREEYKREEHKSSSTTVTSPRAGKRLKLKRRLVDEIIGHTIESEDSELIPSSVIQRKLALGSQKTSKSGIYIYTYTLQDPFWCQFHPQYMCPNTTFYNTSIPNWFPIDLKC